MTEVDTDTFATRLLDWYETRRRDLPWRRNRDPYRVWVSEVMLQQTRVDTVVPYFERFLERFPDIESLARADTDEVLAQWSGLGYYRRARSLQAGAQRVLEAHDGRFPRTLASALEIPGIGPYSAAAILSIAYGEPHAVLDGNVERVVTRLERIAENPRKAAVRRRIVALLDQRIDRARPGDFNQAMMELGATVCRAPSPDCEECPVAAWCGARAHGDTENYPALPPRRKSVPLELETGLLKQGDRYLLERVDKLPFLEGLWLFPIEPIGRTETQKRAATAEDSPLAARLSASLGVRVTAGEQLAPLEHSITFRRLTIRPRVLDAPSLEVADNSTWQWARLDELGSRVAVSSICLKLARRLQP